MTITPSSLLSLPIITTGTESGNWGDDVNNGLTSYLDIAIAGGLSVSITTADVTLANTAGTSSVTGITSTTAQYAILNITGAKTAARTLNLPASSRKYVINNSGTGGFLLTVRGVTPTTGITLVDGERVVIAWNGSDYVKISGTNGPGAFTTLTASGNVNLSPLTTAGTLVISPGGASTMDNVAIGATTRAAGSFTTLNANAAVNLSPLTTAGTLVISPAGASSMDNVAIGATTRAAGSFTTLNANAAVNLSPLTTAGTLVISPAGASTIDNVVIGATTRAAGSFTALNANASVNLSPLTTASTFAINPAAVGTIDNVTIGATTVAAATFARASTTSVAVTFSAGATTINCALSNVFTTTLTANMTTGATLSSPADGQTINWFLTQDSTGSRTIVWPSSFKWSGGVSPALSTAAGSVDLLVATYRSSTGFWYASLAKAFS